MPLDLRAKIWSVPAAIAVTPDKPAGTLNVWVFQTRPNVVTVPSARSTAVKAVPAATATALVTRFKFVNVEIVPDPQVTTVPFALTAAEKSYPALTWTTSLSPEGTVACPELFLPQATTVPSALSARAWSLPADRYAFCETTYGFAVPS